jgi:hypothetical protein
MTMDIIDNSDRLIIADSQKEDLRGIGISRGHALNNLGILAANINIGNEDEHYLATKNFIEKAFDIFEGRRTTQDVLGIDTSKVTHVFTVPARGEHASEADYFLPIADRIDFGIPDNIAFYRQLLSSLPPTIMAINDTNDGILLYIPVPLRELFELADNNMDDDMIDVINGVHKLKKGKGSALISLASIALRGKFGKIIDYVKMGKKLNQIKASTNVAYQAGLDFISRITNNNSITVGQGATLPGLTDFGEHCNTEYQLTSGHRVTIASMCMTTEKILEDDGYDLSKDQIDLGIVGIGSIGRAYIKIMLARRPFATLHIYDINPQVIDGFLRKQDPKDKERIIVHASLNELIDETPYVALATTSKLPEGTNYRDGLILLDDSEPSAAPHEIAKNGSMYVKGIKQGNGNATVIKPLAKATDSWCATNYHKDIGQADSTYNFGWYEGAAYGPGVLPDGMFGCWAETVLCANGNMDSYSGPVNSQHIHEISRLIDSGLIELPQLQGGGMYVDLSAGRKYRENWKNKN